MRAIIKKNSSVPLYEQVAEKLKEQILTKEYDPSGNIGTQTSLAERFGVSLITIRKAIALLCEEGFLTVVQGKGTFVKKTSLQDDLSRLTGVDNIISGSNLSAQVLVSVFEIIDTPADFDEDVKQQLGQRCLHIERVHILRDTKYAFAELYLPLKYGEHLTKLDVEQHTIYQLYEEKWKMELGRGRQIIRADVATAKVAKALDIQEKWPILSITRRSYSASGELVEFMKLSYEYSQYHFEVELKLSSK